MATLLNLLLSISVLSSHSIPAGTELHIRLTSAVGSYASEPGAAVSAVLIAPVMLDGETILPAGSIVGGKVKSVTRVGFGLRHETAGLDLQFDRITPPDGETVSIPARVLEVDNSRERVNRSGRIEGVRSTGSLCYRVSGYIRTMLLWDVHAELAEWAIRSLLMEIPEPEIYYPAGVELTLTLTAPLSLNTATEHQDPAFPQFSIEEGEELREMVSEIPSRTHAPNSDRPSDLTNLLLVGSHDQVVTAFDAAGWSEPTPRTLRERISFIRAVAELRGDEGAPMSMLLLDGAEPDMFWQKGLNDVSKRHHIRLWKAAGTWRGKELWIGAATRDVDFAYWRPGKAVSHRIAENIDEERDKVANDLAFTSCGNILDRPYRADVRRVAHNATGDPIVTDGRMAVVELNDCETPRMWFESSDSTPLPEHGDRLQRFARREILSARNELLRTNPYWRTYEASRWIFESIREHMRQSAARELLSGPANSPGPAKVDPSLSLAVARTANASDVIAAPAH
jgi:hypothetical protein